MSRQVALLSSQSQLITVVRDNDIRFSVMLTSEGTPINLSSVEWVRCYVCDAQSKSLLFQATAFVTDPSRGEIEISFSREQTRKLIPGQIISFDIRVRFQSGEEVTFPSPPFHGVVLDAVTKG